VEYYLGIDIGGTSIKGVCCDKTGKLFADGSVPTSIKKGGDGLCASIEKLANKLKAKVPSGTLCGVGVGCPGEIDSKKGEIVFAGNLGIKNYPLAQNLKSLFGVKVKVANDANVAALGEAKFGAGQNYSDSILVTLGTGVGGGVIIGGKLFEGFKSAGTEIGHMVISLGGNKCTCGRRGCFETYASATALIEKTRNAMAADTTSRMWETYNINTVSGKTAFDYADTDATAKRVVEWYITRLGCGLVNLANIFRPQVIMLGGGVSAQGKKLTEPLQTIMDEEVFGGNERARVEITCATLGNLAGALGGIALVV
jgi:glucokinase